MAKSNNKFKTKASGILKRPESMAEMLSGIPERDHNNGAAAVPLPANKKKALSQKPVKGTGNIVPERESLVERLNCEIGKDLHDRLLNMIRDRKQLPKAKRQQLKASKRAIIEKALVQYLEVEGY